jgi:hypothetical protein
MKASSRAGRDRILTLWRAYLGWTFRDVVDELGAKATVRATGTRRGGPFIICRDIGGVQYSQYAGERRIFTAGFDTRSVQVRSSDGRPFAADALHRASFVVESALITNSPELVLEEGCSAEEAGRFIVGSFSVFGSPVHLVLETSSGQCAEVRVGDTVRFIPQSLCALQAGRRFYAAWDCGTDAVELHRFSTGVKLYAGETSAAV